MHMLGVCWVYTMRMLGVCWVYAVRMLGVCYVGPQALSPKPQAPSLEP